jgi:hypothetical protein
MVLISGELKVKSEKKKVKSGPVKDVVVESNGYKVSRVTNPQELANLLKGLL